jgi:hypothetical protein
MMDSIKETLLSMCPDFESYCDFEWHEVLMENVKLIIEDYTNIIHNLDLFRKFLASPSEIAGMLEP